MYFETAKIKLNSYENYDGVNVYFDSMTEVINYIDSHVDSDDVYFKRYANNRKQEDFNITNSYNEAITLSKTGWNEGTSKINELLTKKYNINNNCVKTKPEYSISGFQCSVPRYLQGIPTNMINTKRVPAKQKTMTIVKHIGFLCNVTTDEIIDNSTKALAIIQKLESQGTRCNLDIISPCTVKGYTINIRIRIKSAKDKSNIGILAFAIAHPDMLRRVIFALRIAIAEDETITQVPEYAIGTWKTIYNRDVILNQILKPNEKYLHNFIDNVEDEVEKFNSMK